MSDNKQVSVFDLSQRAAVTRPAFNEQVVEGVPYHQFKNVIEHLNTKFMEIQPHADHIGLKFKGIRMARPSEENEQSHIPHRSVGSRLRLNRSTLYMVAITYEYDGKDMVFYTRLPYISRGNPLVLDGKKFFLSPVLMDRGTSISKDGIFLSAITRLKINFTRLRYMISVNNFNTHSALLYATMYMGTTKKAPAAERLSMKPLIFIYLLIQKGAHAAFKDYFGVDVIFEEGTYSSLAKKYPLDKYTIYSSSGIRPQRLAKSRWETPALNMIIKDVSVENQEFHTILATNFFYIYDHFTTVITLDTLDDTDVWEVIAGQIIFNSDESNQKLAERVRSHIDRSIDVLLDASAIKELSMDGIEVGDIYELLAWLVRNGTIIFMTENPASMENKRLASLRYTLSPITHSINKLGYALLLMDGPQDPKRLKNLIRRCYLKEGLIRDIRKDHGEVSSLQCSTDNIFLNISRNIVPQARALGKSARGGLPMYNSDNFLHESIFMIGQITGISKPGPTGRDYINPFVSVDKYGNISYDALYTPNLNRLSAMIRYDYGFLRK